LSVVEEEEAEVLTERLEEEEEEDSAVLQILPSLLELQSQSLLALEVLVEPSQVLLEAKAAILSLAPTQVLEAEEEEAHPQQLQLFLGALEEESTTA
jgi:hypothetical protein